MHLKSITFRCSSRQYDRLTQALNQADSSRTDLLTKSLAAFLQFAEQEHIRHLNLFELVQAVDALSGGTRFSDQA